MKFFKKFILWLFLGALTGVICGLCGTLFSKAVGFVTEFRQGNQYIILFLALGGLLSVLTYKLCHVESIGVGNVFDLIKNDKPLPYRLPIAIFLGTCISHLFGASSGREGAALQIGGGVANLVAKIFRLDARSHHITIMCGMAALFSAVFGTPFAACVFVLEIILTSLSLYAAIPVLLSSITGFAISTVLGLHPERFNIGVLPRLSFSLVYKTAIITAVCIFIAFVFCKGLSLGKTFAKKVFKNEFLRIAVGGLIITALTLLIGNFDYNGGGIDIIEHAFEGNVKYEAFALKILFTIICVSVGFKGGEIIPTLFIGATLGGAAALLLALPVGTGAAIGMAVLFVCATKCPLATILLCGEMFGFTGLPIIIPVVIISFCFARYKGLYSNTTDIITLIKAKNQTNSPT